MSSSGASYRSIECTLRCLLFSMLLGVASLAQGQSKPLYSPPNTPVTALLGLPSPRAAEVLPSGQFSADMLVSATSHYVRRERTNESLLWDGETWRAALQLRMGLSEGWELQLEMPWLRQHGGSLDGLIDGWHSLWGLPDGGRSRAARGALDYRYTGPQASFALNESESGVGDLSASLHRQIWHSERATVQWAAGLKVATGRPRAFHGSGAESLHTALYASGPLVGSMQWHANIGYLQSRRSPLLGSAQRLGLWFGGLGVGLPISRSLSLVAQLDAHEAPLRSELTALGSSAWRLTAGLQWQASPRWLIEASVVEDIRVNTAADVGFQLGFRRSH